MGWHFCLLEGSITFHLQLQTWSIQQKEYRKKRDKLMKVLALDICKLQSYTI